MEFEFEGRSIAAEAGDSTLDALLKSGENIEHGCKAGACQACLLRSVAGTAPSSSTESLDDAIVGLGGFLACRATAGSVERIIRFDDSEVPQFPARVVSRQNLSDSVFELRLETEVCGRPGQFIRLLKSDDLSRCYSLAEVNGSEVALHIRLVPGGLVSTFLGDVKPGQTLRLRGPFGKCMYRASANPRPLLLIATGTGLAPVYGVLGSALAQGHQGPIHLYHGAESSDGLYFREQLSELSRKASSLSYTPCADHPTAEGDRSGSPLDAALHDLPDLEAFQVYLCGHPAMVRSGQKRCFLAGTNLEDIFADPFENQA